MANELERARLRGLLDVFGLTALAAQDIIGAVAAGMPVGAYTAPMGSLISVAVPQNVLTVTPLFVPRAVTLDRIGGEATVAAAGSTIRYGIYEDDGDGYPSRLLLDAGTVDTSTTGVKEITISQAVPGERIWLGAVSQGGAPTVRALQDNNVWMNAVADSAAVLLGNLLTGYQQSDVTGALPDPFTTTLSARSTCHRVIVRVA
jgi:hypothetical protein